MKENKIFAVGKLAVAIFAISAVWLFFGAVAPASAGGLSCYWTASSSQNMSDSTNWYDATLDDGSSCSDITNASLQFRDDFISPSATSSNATWDSGLPLALSVAVDVSYTGVVSIGETDVTTTYFNQAGGTVSTTGSGILRVGGSFIINGNAKWAGVTGMNVVLNGETGFLTISTTSVDFYDLVIDGEYTSNGTDSVIINNDLTINSGKTLILSAMNNELIIDGNFYNSGTITQSNASYTIMRGAGVTLGGSGTTTLYNLTLTAASVTLTGDIEVDSNISVDADSTLDLATYDLNLACNLDNFGTITQTSGTVSMTDTSTNYTLGGSGATTFYNLISTGVTTTLAGDLAVINVLTIDADTEFDAATFNLTLSGDGIPLVQNGLFTTSASTIIYSGTAAIASSTYYNLTIGAGAGTLSANATVSNDLTVGSGATLDLDTYDLALTGSLFNSGTVTQAGGTVTMSGDAVSLGATGGSTSLYNLTISGNTTTLAGDVTTANVLTIDADKELDAGAKSITLSKASGIPLVITGTFTASTSEVNYTGTGVVSTTAATYYDLVFGTGTYFFSDNTTSTNSFTNSGTTTVWVDKYLYVPGTFDNNGTMVEDGAIQHPLTSAKITNSAGIETAAFNATSDSVYVTVEDSDGNLDANAVDTITGSVVTAVSLISDSETITLTETGANTGIFRSAALPLTVSSAATTNSGIFEVSFNGNLTLAFVDSKQSSDTDSDTATFTATQYVTSGSGSGGGGSPSDTTPPTNTSVVIAAGAGSTDTTSVTLTLTATDASQMMISNASDFTGSIWETYATTKTWTLTSGVGIKTVYAKFKDTAGNISAAVSDTIDSTATTTVTPPVTPPSGSGCPALVAGDMVKVTGKPAIYAVNSAMKIMYFPSGDEFKSWRPTYGGYYSITQTCFDALSVPTSYPAAVNYHPGSYVIKRASSDQLYVVEPGNKLAKITSTAATSLYGTAYTTMTIADPFWPHYVNRGTDIAAAKAHPGMLVKVGAVTYYVDADNKLREVTTGGMAANGFQTRFVRTVPASAIEGFATGVKITAEIKALTDKTQETVE